MSASEDIINGLCCQSCGQYFENEVGYPRTCNGCNHPAIAFIRHKPDYSHINARKERYRNQNKETARRVFLNAFCAIDEHTEYHWKVYINSQRVDYYPTSSKYHVISTGKRGKATPEEILTLLKTNNHE